MKKKVGILLAGYSSEKSISIKSGMAVFNSLSRDAYEPYLIFIEKEAWYVQIDEKKYPIDKNDFSTKINGAPLSFDVLFNAIHGTPGEDGLIQAYLELLDIPHTSSQHFESALTFNKAETSSLLSHHKVITPKAYYYKKGETIQRDQIIKSLGLPCFVKPNRAGSSYGVSKVSKKEDLEPAIKEALKEDSQIVIEEAIIGREIGCGVAFFDGKTQILNLTEIISENDFFDYSAKYEGKSQEITPANIEENLRKKIEEEAKFIYESLNLRGISRVDFIISEKNNHPYFIEVNTVPGLSEESIVPQQIDALNISRGDFYGKMIEEALSFES